MEKDQELKDNAYAYITAEKTAYETRGVPLTGNWEWSMKDHIERSFLLKNSKFFKGNNDSKRPFKNIILPILNVAYRSEGFDVKDIVPYVNEAKNYYKSFLVKKFHPKWARKYSIDTFIDELVESYVDYGLALVKNVNDVRPEVVPLQRIAFCDQTDILSGPICEKHQYSIDQLLDMKGRWYEEEVDMAVLQAKASKNVSLAKKDAKTPGKYVEVYELHGTFPKTWLNVGGEEEYTEEDGYCPQIHIITYYKNADGKDTGICLFKGKEKKPIYKAIKRTNRFGTACGMGGIEELFDAQTWTNYSEIHLQKMLEATSKIVLQTTDKKFANANKISDLQNNQILVLEEGKTLGQVPLQPINKNAFDNYVNSWEQNARVLGSASDPALGLNPTSGTPLGTTEIITQQGVGIHEFRRGQIATFVSEIYRDWVLGFLVKDMNKGDRWLDELTLEEMQEVAEKISITESNKRIVDMMLKPQGKRLTQAEADFMRQTLKEEFMKGGKKRFLEVMKDELKKLPMDVDVSIANKQKMLADVVSKLNGVFRTIFETQGQVFQIPGMSDLFNQIIENSGLNPIDFTSFTRPVAPAEPTAVPSPISPELPVTT